MREIKFRAWVPEDHWINRSGRGEYIYDWQDKTYVESVGFNPCEDGIVIEEFIGIRDAEDRDIYEGDIVQCSDAAFYRIVTYLTIRASFFFVHRDSWYPAAVATTSHAETVVVGNIHENPELLS